MTLEEFGKAILENTCARGIRDERDRNKVVYNATDIPKEHLEQFYVYDLHCAIVSVWVKHTETGPKIVEYVLRYE